jgi:hypothetical protein
MQGVFGKESVNPQENNVKTNGELRHFDFRFHDRCDGSTLRAGIVDFLRQNICGIPQEYGAGDRALDENIAAIFLVFFAADKINRRERIQRAADGGLGNAEALGQVFDRMRRRHQIYRQHNRLLTRGEVIGKLAHGAQGYAAPEVQGVNGMNCHIKRARRFAVTVQCEFFRL